MNKLFSLGLAFLLALVATGCQLYFGEEGKSGDSYCAEDGYYVNGEWASAQCPGGGNACTANKDCAAGCFCDQDAKTCDEAGFCSKNSDCPAGFDCDERSSCVPSSKSCAAEILPSCTNGAPKCPQGSVPLVDGTTGCYADVNADGQFDCQAIAECGAPPSCDRFQWKDDCSNAGCTTITSGQNCRIPGTNAPCQDGQAGCVCQSYPFSRCEAPAGM
jgi:hypothetical protein